MTLAMLAEPRPRENRGLHWRTSRRSRCPVAGGVLRHVGDIETIGLLDATFRGSIYNGTTSLVNAEMWLRAQTNLDANNARNAHQHRRSDRSHRGNKTAPPSGGASLDLNRL